MEKNEDSKDLLDNIDFPQQGLSPEELYDTLEAAGDIDVKEDKKTHDTKPAKYTSSPRRHHF